MERHIEQKLVAAVQENKCQKSYTKLVEGLQLYKRVYCFVQKYLRDPLDIEEVTQETMVRAFLNIHNFKADKGRFRSWVIGIAMHRACDWISARRHQSLFELADIPEMNHSPEDLAVITQQENAFLVAIDELKGRYRDILYKFYIEGLSHQELAEMSGMTTNNVSTLLNRAKARCMVLYKRQLSQAKKPQGVRSRKKRKSARPSKTAMAFGQTFSALNQRMVAGSARTQYAAC